MNTSNGEVCPICETSNPGKILLVPIPGTEDGHISQAKQFHADCVQLAAQALLMAVQSEIRAKD
jgi:hypothetical protein